MKMIHLSLVILLNTTGYFRENFTRNKTNYLKTLVTVKMYSRKKANISSVKIQLYLKMKQLKAECEKNKFQKDSDFQECGSS